LAELIRYELAPLDARRWNLQFDVDTAAFHRLMTQRLGRTILMTNRMDWEAEPIVAGYGGQQSVEKVFRGLKDGDWLNWGPMYHWTDSKIRVHAFYCMLGISLLSYVHRQVQNVCPAITIEQLKQELADILQFCSALSSSRREGALPYRHHSEQAESHPIAAGQRHRPREINPR